MPRLSIVIITLNEEVRLPRLLSDLECQTWKDFEIIHVDSNSTDSTIDVSADWQRKFANYSIIEMDKRGVSLGRNTGASYAQGQHILFLDADVRLHPNFLWNAICELYNKELDVAAVCMSGEGLPLKHRLGYSAFNLGIQLTSGFYPTAVGACIFSTPEAHNLIGGFDERLQLCEDCNYALKAKREKSLRFGLLRTKFSFDPRRLNQDGTLKTGLTYLRANVHRFFKGELYQGEIRYEFGHYK
ncbi:glycosyltransferase [Rhodobacteraceae bacterium RKSG542]|nr:glycosyltransferase [Pseudovibrio flavus]